MRIPKVGDSSQTVPPLGERPAERRRALREAVDRKYRAERTPADVELNVQTVAEARAKEREANEEALRTEKIRALYPKLMNPDDFSTAQTNTRSIFASPQGIRGRKVDLGSSNRGQGAVVKSGHTHAPSGGGKGIKYLTR
jgi:hypothetical protein